MKLALNGATTMRADLATDLHAAKAAGFDYLEIWAAKLRAFLKERTTAELKNLFSESGLLPLSINSIEHITFRDAPAYESIKRECEELSSIAAAVGCPCIVVVPGRLPSGGASRATVIAESVRVLTELCDIASKHNVSLAFEFLGQTDCSVPTLDLAAEIVREVNRKDLGVVIDSFHFYAGNSTVEMIEALDPNLIQIFHINDAEDLPRTELQDCHRLLPGLGILPLQKMITTPNTQHVSLALASIETGKHVFCEKPLATSVADAERVFKKAGEGRGVFQVGHNRRFAPVYATLKRMLAETHPPHSAHVKMNRGELLKPEWTGDPGVTGGFLYETPIHMFDMMRFLFGEVETVHAAGSTHEYKEIDDFSVLMKFANGMHATLATAADASWLFPFERVEVFSHHASIVTREMESLTYSTSLEGNFTEQTMQQLPREEKWGYVQEDLAFIDAIVNGSEPLVTAFDGLMSVRLVDAVYESVRSKSPVTIGEVSA